MKALLLSIGNIIGIIAISTIALIIFIIEVIYLAIKGEKNNDIKEKT